MQALGICVPSQAAIHVSTPGVRAKQGLLRLPCASGAVGLEARTLLCPQDASCSVCHAHTLADPHCCLI